MKRLRQLRESFNLSQDGLAKKLNTTQQTIARWESGKSEPGIAALKDLALIFHTSVDDLLEYAVTGKNISSSLYYLLTEPQDGFWGHIGIQIAQRPSVWFPITAGIADKLADAFDGMNHEKSWVLFPTLANQYIALHPSCAQKITILDDASDHPQADWELAYPYNGLPQELYRGFEVIDSIGFSKNELYFLAEVYKKRISNTALNASETRKLKLLLEAVFAEFKNEVSENFILVSAVHFIEEKLFEEARYRQYMSDVNIYGLDGHKTLMMDGTDTLMRVLSVLGAGGAENTLLKFQSPEEGSVFMPKSRIAMITMPYSLVLEGRKELEKSLKERDVYDK